MVSVRMTHPVPPLDAQPLRALSHLLAVVVLPAVAGAVQQVARLFLAVQYRQTVVAARRAALATQQPATVRVVELERRHARRVGDADHGGEAAADGRRRVRQLLHQAAHRHVADLNARLLLDAASVVLTVTLHEHVADVVLDAEQRRQRHLTLAAAFVRLAMNERRAVHPVVL